MKLKIAVALAGALAAVLILVVFRPGHHRASPVIAQDVAPFEQAVVAYLKAKSFGMKPVRLEDLQVQDQAAVATYRLQDAEGTYNVAVAWTFTFKRDGLTGWVVTEHKAE